MPWRLGSKRQKPSGVLSRRPLVTLLPLRNNRSRRAQHSRYEFLRVDARFLQQSAGARTRGNLQERRKVPRTVDIEPDPGKPDHLRLETEAARCLDMRHETVVAELQ